MKWFNKIINSNVLQSLRSTLHLGYNELPKTMDVVKTSMASKVGEAKTTMIYKVGEANTWYTKVIGLDEVHRYQKRVVDLQEKLLSAQDTRRDIGTQLAVVRKQSNELQDQIHKVKRQDDFQRFLDLMKEETDLLKKEQELVTSFNGQDRLEREIFTAFTNSIRDSHEKQRAHTEYTKYLGIILGILGSFLSFVYVTFHRSSLRSFIEDQMAQTSTKFEPVLQKLEKNELALMQTIKLVGDESKQLVNVINNNLRKIANNDVIVQNLSQNEEVIINAMRKIENDVNFLLTHSNNIHVNEALHTGGIQLNNSFQKASQEQFLRNVAVISLGLISCCILLRLIT